MATIQLTSGFTVCPEGTHIFRIYKVEYNQDFGKLNIHLVNAQGITHMERFSLINASGVPNEQAYNAFSYFAKTALNDYTLGEIDPNWLVNHYIKATVVHKIVPSNKEEGKTMTFTNLSDKWAADGFDTTPVAKALTLGTETEQPKVAEPTSTPAPTQTTGLNLDTLLG
jgi:hypothetical protein